MMNIYDICEYLIYIIYISMRLEQKGNLWRASLCLDPKDSHFVSSFFFRPTLGTKKLIESL